MSILTPDYILQYIFKSQEVFFSLPQQRKLADTDIKDAEAMLSVNGNKKLIQQKLQAKTGLCITLKDLHNTKSRMHMQEEKNSLADLVVTLKKREGKLSVKAFVTNMIFYLFVYMCKVNATLQIVMFLWLMKKRFISLVGS